MLVVWSRHGLLCFLWQVEDAGAQWEEALMVDVEGWTLHGGGVCVHSAALLRRQQALWELQPSQRMCDGLCGDCARQACANCWGSH